MLLLLCLAFYHLTKIVTASVLYDDAFIASAAKNLALGYGYSTSYPALIPFDPEITTGPVMVLPTAVLIWLFGNQYWIPNLSITLGIWVAFIAVLVLLYRRLERIDWYVAVVLMVLSMFFTSEEFGLLGERPAALLVITSALLVCHPQARTRWASALGGLALGCAIKIKLITLLALPAFVGFLVIENLLRGVRPGITRRSLAHLVCCMAGVLAPGLAWDSWQYIAATGTGMSGYEINQRDVAYLKETQSLSGLAHLLQAGNKARYLLSTSRRNASMLLEHFGGWPYVLAFACVVLISGRVIFRSVSRHRWASQQYASALLLCAGCTHLLWWLWLSPTGWYRHLLPATIYVSVALVLLAPSCLRLSGRLATAYFVFLLLSWYPRLYDGFQGIRWSFSPKPRLVALLETRDKVQELQRESNIVLVGCAWWVPRDLEYLLPAVGNFKDCLQLKPSETLDKRTILVRNEFFNWEGTQRLKRFQESCDGKILFRKEPFVISECVDMPNHASR